ncbi:hypothetical protein FB451DRAFT_1266898 [Mycena latifolia]|nr:hypothetical protein FB451DRAFT_1266898 [Mycena latifolia]
MAKATKAVPKCVTDLLGMIGKVTPRPIAYIVILVYFALTNASTWMPEYYVAADPQISPTHAASAAVHRTAVDSRSQLRTQRAAMEAEASAAAAAAAEGAAMEAE